MKSIHRLGSFISGIPSEGSQKQPQITIYFEGDGVIFRKDTTLGSDWKKGLSHWGEAIKESANEIHKMLVWWDNLSIEEKEKKKMNLKMLYDGKELSFGAFTY